MSYCDGKVIWPCPVCGKPMYIGPAFMNFAPYCSDPKCSYNYAFWMTATTTCKNEKEKEDE